MQAVASSIADRIFFHQCVVDDEGGGRRRKAARRWCGRSGFRGWRAGFSHARQHQAGSYPRDRTELHQVNACGWHRRIEEADLRTACAHDFGTAYDPKECLITVGGKHVIFNLIQALINPGDEVVIPVPYWVTYMDVVNYAGGKFVFVNTDEAKGFTLTAAMIEPHLTERTKLVMMNSPSNPSGAVMDRGEFEKIFHLTAERGIYLMTDECYCKFLYDSEPFSIASMPGAKESVLVAGSLSKTYAMTGWRIGFGLVPAAIVGAMNKLQSHSTSNPASISQKAAVEALRGPQESVGIMLAEYRKRRDFVVNRLRAIPGVKCQEPRGAFYAYPNVGVVIGRNGIQNTLQLSERLLSDAHVAVVPGEAFGTDQHIRISYATSMKELERGLDRIHQFIVKNS